MLVISRHVDESVTLRPSGITVVIAGVCPNTGRVKIGIDAPLTEQIIRGELLEGWTSRNPTKTKQEKKQ